MKNNISSWVKSKLGPGIFQRAVLHKLSVVKVQCREKKSRIYCVFSESKSNFLQVLWRQLPSKLSAHFGDLLKILTKSLYLNLFRAHDVEEENTLNSLSYRNKDLLVLLWMHAFLHWSSSASPEQSTDFHPSCNTLLHFNLNQDTFSCKSKREELDYSSLKLLIPTAAVSWNK